MEVTLWWQHSPARAALLEMDLASDVAADAAVGGIYLKSIITPDPL